VAQDGGLRACPYNFDDQLYFLLSRTIRLKIYGD